MYRTLINGTWKWRLSRELIFVGMQKCLSAFVCVFEFFECILIDDRTLVSYWDATYSNTWFRRPQSFLRNGWSESGHILLLRLYQVLACRWQTTSLMVKVTWPVFKILPQIISLELVQLDSSNCVCWLIQTTRSTSVCTVGYLRKGCVKSHVTSLNFGK